MQDAEDEDADDVTVADDVGVADDEDPAVEGVDVVVELGAEVADDVGVEELSVGEEVAEAELEKDSDALELWRAVSLADTAVEEVDADEAAAMWLVEAVSLRVDVASDRAVLVDSLDPLVALPEVVPDVILDSDGAVALDDEGVDADARSEATAENDVLADLETSAPPSALPDPPVPPQPTQTTANVAATTRCASVIRSMTDRSTGPTSSNRAAGHPKG